MDAAFNLARWILRNEHDAEDAVQDAYLKAYRAFGGFRGGEGRPWLLAIVRNVCYSRMRSVRREGAAERFDEAAHGGDDSLAETNAALWREVKSEQLQAAMERLPEEFREVVVLHELEGLPYREIASVTGVPIGTVMSRLSRARRRLESELTKPAEGAQSHGL
jgi:RNA polymerase sigma-70 factor (ECF subfamily)